MLQNFSNPNYVDRDLGKSSSQMTIDANAHAHFREFPFAGVIRKATTKRGAHIKLARLSIAFDNSVPGDTMTNGRLQTGHISVSTDRKELPVTTFADFVIVDIKRTTPEEIARLRPPEKGKRGYHEIWLPARLDPKTLKLLLPPIRVPLRPGPDNGPRTRNMIEWPHGWGTKANAATYMVKLRIKVNGHDRGWCSSEDLFAA